MSGQLVLVQGFRGHWKFLTVVYWSWFGYGHWSLVHLNSEYCHIKDQQPYPNQDQYTKPQSGSSSVLQSPKLGLKGHGCSLHLQNQDTRAMIWIIGVSKTSDPIQNKIKIPNSSQEPPASSKALYQDLKEVEVLWTFQIHLESKNFYQWCIKVRELYQNYGDNLIQIRHLDCPIKPKIRN